MRKSAVWAWSLMLIVVVVMTAATLVDGSFIYGTWWFRLLWLALAIAAVRHLIAFRLWKRFWVMAIHAALLVILAGAALTALTAHRGQIHLRQDSPTELYAQDNDRVRHLPFEMVLDSFRIDYYPGTQTARDYTSHVRINGQPHVIAMNRIAQCQGYRFYQSSYDRDNQGSILRVNYDPYGTATTYTGYALLALAMFFYLIGMRGRGKTCLLFLLFIISTPAQAIPTKETQVLWQGRPAPMGTLAKDFVTKLHGRATYKSMDAMAVMAAWEENPKQWAAEPIIRCKDGTMACLNDFLDLSVMPPRLVGVEQNPQLAEKVALALEWTQGDLVRPLPANVAPRSDFQIRAELFYNRLDWTLCGMIACWLLVIACFFYKIKVYTTCMDAWQCVLNKKPRKAFRAEDASPCVPMPGNLFHCARMALFLFLLTAFVLRWNAAGRIPLTSGHETLHFAALCVILLSGISKTLRHEAAALIPAAFLLLVARLGEKDPGITPLMPVLHSPWLSAHVSVIMLSYAMLMLSIVDRRMLRPAVCLLAAGIFLGAVWANVSWGAYWSWDPKETWALATMLVYSVPLHTQSLPWFRSARNYRIYSLVALACLAMTYWGVNYLLGGMHSYAS